MVIDLKPLFSGRVDNVPIDCTLDLSGVDYQGSLPFGGEVRVHGTVRCLGEAFMLTADVSFCHYGDCARCLAHFEHPGSISIRMPLSQGGEVCDNDDGETVYTPDSRLDVDELVTAELLLSLPAKTLCTPDCRGLCPYCGRNLNEGLCGCRADKTDPRLAALKELLD